MKPFNHKTQSGPWKTNEALAYDQRNAKRDALWAKDGIIKTEGDGDRTFNAIAGLDKAVAMAKAFQPKGDVPSGTIQQQKDGLAHVKSALFAPTADLDRFYQDVLLLSPTMMMGRFTYHSSTAFSRNIKG